VHRRPRDRLPKVLPRRERTWRRRDYHPPPPSPFSTAGVDVDVALLADAGGAVFVLSAQAPTSDAAVPHKRAASTRTGMLSFFMAH
jgi:hypothetical protein